MTYQMIDVNDILNKEQIKNAMNVINSNQSDPIPLLKEYFANIKQDLKINGIIPDYLAYAFWYAMIVNDKQPINKRRIT